MLLTLYRPRIMKFNKECEFVVQVKEKIQIFISKEVTEKKSLYVLFV